MAGLASAGTPAVNPDRLQATLRSANRFGRNGSTGGINRHGFSDADFGARRWLMQEMREAGLHSVRMDGVGNVFGRFGPADAPVVLCGSHIDSVPEGGCFDGVLGVVAALECIRAFQDHGLKHQDLHVALEVVATAEEEGRFGGMLGSQAMAGLVDADWLENSRDADGVALKDAMRSQGLNYQDALDDACRRRGGVGPGQVCAFVELHVEQGPILEQSGLLAGVVTGISGTANPIFTLHGEANHSGTTPMHLRRDAVAGFCEVGAAVPSILKECGSADARVTIGKVDVEPNFPHTVAGEVRFAVNIRDSDEGCMSAMQSKLTATVHRTAKKHGLTVDVDDRLGRLAPVRLDKSLQQVLADEAASYFQDQGQRPNNESSAAAGALWRFMPSGAGHDAQNMQEGVCPSAMLFVPSCRGISHAVEEFTEDDHVASGAQLLCNFLHRICVREPQILLQHERFFTRARL